MLYKCLPLFLSASGLMAQTLDLASQVRLIQILMPNATRCAVVFNPENTNMDYELAKMTQETGILVVKTPVNSVRKIPQALRTLENYQVDFIYLVEDRVVTSSTGIRFVAKPSLKDNIPVFSTTDRGFKAGLYGQLFRAGGIWRMRVNGRVYSRFDIQVPDGDDRFLFEEGGVPD